MALELKQQLKLSQSLVMTPQLQLAIKLLQLSRLELVDLVREEIQLNPVLDDTVEAGPLQDSAAKEPEPKSPEVDWQSYIEEQADYAPSRINFSDKPEEDDYLGNISSKEGGLKEHLSMQLNLLGLPEIDLRLGEFIVGNIGEDGYLRLLDRAQMDDAEYEAAVTTEISRLTGVSEEDALRVLNIVQQLDPLGVGSRTLRECLLAQARLLPVRDTVVEEIVKDHLKPLANRNYKAIARSLEVTVDEVVDAARTINRSLNPTPGAGFGGEEARAILPDIFIHKVGDEYVISLNEDGMPKLKVSRYYRGLLKTDGGMTEQAKTYLQDKFRSALWLIKSVHQRQRTIYKVVECIVKFQKDFLDNGLQYLKPLVLNDVAEETGVHESTVSRVTTNKYVQTPRGIFELKYFFGNGLAMTDGSDVTVEYIKEKVRGIIESEDSLHPYSDQQIIELLKASGITLARRTATKYREALGFLSSNKRKARF
jgi:RNA polymerase sigma-54 factor